MAAFLLTPDIEGGEWGNAVIRLRLLVAALALMASQHAFSEQQYVGLPETVRQIISADDVAALRTWVSEHPDEAQRWLNAKSGLIDSASKHSSRDVMLYLVTHAEEINPVWRSISPRRMKAAEALADSFLGTWTDDQRDVLDETLLLAALDLAYEILYMSEEEPIDDLRGLVALLLRHGGDYTIEVAAYLGDAARVKFLDPRLTRQPTDSKSFKFDSDGPYDPALDAFQIAVQFCHAEMVEYFLEKGFDPNQWVGDFLYYPAITYACEYGSDRCLHALLDAGADPNVVVFENCQVGRSGPPYRYDGLRPIDIVLIASDSRHEAFERVQLLADHGATVFVDSESQSNPLATAIMATNVEAVRYFLERGADAKSASAFNLTGLSYDQEYLLQEYFHEPAWSNSVIGTGSVTTYMVNGRVVITAPQDAEGETNDPNSSDHGYRFTPLQVAADQIGSGNDHELLSIWLGGVANAKQRASKVATAARAGQIVALLRKFGAVDDLYTAVSLDESHQIRQLLSDGATLSFPNWRDALLNRAIQLGNTAALATLIDSGFNANSTGPVKPLYEKQGSRWVRTGYREGDSVLTRVVRTGHRDLLEVALEHNADVRGAGTGELNSESEGPIFEAVVCDNAAILGMLLVHGVPAEELTRAIKFADSRINEMGSQLDESNDTWTHSETRRVERARLVSARSQLKEALIDASSRDQ